MRKIIHIITDLSTGGAQMMLCKLLSNYDKNLFNPIVISLMNSGGILDKYIKKLGIPLYFVGLNNYYPRPIAFYNFIKYLYKLKPDIIQGWMYHGNMAASLAGLFLLNKIPILWNIRHTPYNLKEEKLFISILIRLGALFSYQTKCIIYNSLVSVHRHKLLGYNNKISKIIPNGFDCFQFKPSLTARLSLRGELKIKRNDLIIGFIARYHPMKNHTNFIRAAGKLVSEYPDVHFVLVGIDVDKSNSVLVDLIKEKGIMSQVHLLGERNDIPEVTAAFDIATNFSSWGESFSNAVGEAMACGIPCVVTNIGDSAWIVGDTGMIVPPENIDELVKAWIKLKKIGSLGRKQLGQKARERIMNKFSLLKIVNSYEETYRKILNINK